MTGQASTSPFINTREGPGKSVAFDTREELGDKIDKLTVMMGKLTVKDSNRNRPFEPQIHKSRNLDLQVRTEVTVREVIRIGPE